jgi:hypothetical protein
MALAGSLAPSWGIGRAGRAILGPESALETIASLTPSGYKAVSLLSGGVTRTQERIERTDRRAYAGISERITGKKATSWELEAYAMCAAAGVAPPLQRIFLMSQWAETIDSGVSVTYAPSITAADWVSGFMLFDCENVSQLAHGCYTEEFSISFDGTGPAKMSASGIASVMYQEGTSTVSGTEATGQTVISVTDAEYFEVGGYVQFGSDNNSGAGYKVTAIDTAADTITVSPAIAGAGLSAGNVAAPMFPSGTSLTGTPISGNLGTVSIGSVTMTALSGKVTVSNVLDTTAGAFGIDRYNQAVKVDHRVKVSLECYATNANFIMAQRSALFANQSSVITLGTTAPNRIVMTMPYLEWNLTNLNHSGDGGQLFSLEGIAKYSSGNDDLTIKFY